MSTTLSPLGKSEMQLLRSWPLRLELRWQFASPTHSMNWTSKLLSHLTTTNSAVILFFVLSKIFLWICFWSLHLQDHRVKWGSVSPHLQAVPDSHQSYGPCGGACGVHHCWDNGEMHYPSVWRSWWEVWGPLPGGTRYGLNYVMKCNCNK